MSHSRAGPVSSLGGRYSAHQPHARVVLGGVWDRQCPILASSLARLLGSGSSFLHPSLPCPASSSLRAVVPHSPNLESNHPFSFAEPILPRVTQCTRLELGSGLGLWRSSSHSFSTKEVLRNLG